jgi:hypothetical protein
MEIEGSAVWCILQRILQDEVSEDIVAEEGVYTEERLVKIICPHQGENFKFIFQKSGTHHPTRNFTLIPNIDMV